MIPDTYSSEEKTEIERRHRLLIDAWQTRKETADLEMVDKAFYFAVDAHKNQRRRTGEPYIYHPIAVATIAAHDIGLGRTSIVCALLHDVVEDTSYTLDDITERFGEKVSRIIDGLTKINQTEQIESIQAENFRKIISSLSYDIRVVLIKLADRLHNMRTLDSMPSHKQLKIASETAYMYAPLAYRLGLYAIKCELEDLSLKYTDPAVYYSIRQRMDEVRETRTDDLNGFIAPVTESMKELGINVEAKVVQRTINSVWKRMQEKGLSFEELFGAYYVRFIIDCPLKEEKVKCWEAYAALTSHYRPNTSKLKDWVSTPKVNGYESLHAILMGEKGVWVEVQIRTHRMDEIAEKGFAAYWKYKSDENTESGFDEWLKRIQTIINSDSNSALDFVGNFKLDLYSDEIFVFTPKGKMISLPKGAKVLDLAYHIHTKIGNHSIAANVNNRLVQLDKELHTGDQVEIITSESQHPQENWFEFLATAYAKARLKAGIKDYRKQFRETGEAAFEQIMKKIGEEPSKFNRSRIMENEDLSSAIDFFFLIATGKITEQSIRNILKPHPTPSNIVKYLTFGLLGSDTKMKQHKNDLKQSGEFDFCVATCCNPIPGDDVMAFSFSDEPLQIHRSNCPKAIEMMSHYGNNIVRAKWQPKSEISFLAGLKITALDTMGLLNRITDLLSNELKLNLHALHMVSQQNVIEALLSVYVHNTKELDNLMDKLSKLKEVQKISRVEHVPNH